MVVIIIMLQLPDFLVVLEEGVEVLVLVELLLVDLVILHQHHHHKEIMVELEPMQILDLLLVVEEEVLVVLELILVLLELLDLVDLEQHLLSPEHQ